jgi:hypothetical protein
MLRHGGRALTRAPGASVALVVPFEPAFDTHRGRAALEPFTYGCVLRFGVDFTGLTASAGFDLALDFRETRPLLTPLRTGEAADARRVRGGGAQVSQGAVASPMAACYYAPMRECRRAGANRPVLVP